MNIYTTLKPHQAFWSVTYQTISLALQTLIKTTKHSKYITLNNLNEIAISKIKDGLAASHLPATLNRDLNVNPNLTYDIIDKQVADAGETFLLVKIETQKKIMDDSR